jgi:hypothetical protein
MALTNDLITQFAKLTQPKAKATSESIVYGTVVESDGLTYVQLDGSNVLTPYTSTTNVAAGERVTVMIKNHTMTITGNKTSPAARNVDLELAANEIRAEVNGELANYSPTSIVDGSRLIINKDKIHMDTPIFTVNVSGTNGDMTLDEQGLSAEYINSPSIRPMYFGPALMTVQTDTADGINTFNTLSDAFYRLNGRYLPYEVVIEVRSAQPEGTAELSYTDGAPITIRKAADVSAPAINAHLEFISVSNVLTLDSINVGYTSGDTAATATNCSSIIARSCSFVTSTKTLRTAHAFAVYRSAAEFYSCNFFDGYAGVYGEWNARILMDTCKGNNNQYGILIRSGSWAGTMTSVPPGSSAAVYATGDSEIRGTQTAGTATSPFSPTATSTVELTLTNTRTYGGGWYSSGATSISQGVSGGTSFRGYMWFDFSPISGKTVKQAAIRLYRKAGVGKSAAVDIYIGAARCAGPGESVEAYSEYGKVGSVPQKEGVKFSVPVAAMQAIANGTYNCLYVYSTQSTDYAAFDGIGETTPPRLAVSI